MYENTSIQIGMENDLYSYMDEVTSKYKNVYNVANYFLKLLS